LHQTGLPIAKACPSKRSLMLSVNNVKAPEARVSHGLCFFDMSLLDPFIISLDNALRTLSGVSRASRPNPGAQLAAMPPTEELTPDERQLAGSLMRVNHVGEVCAQALYQAQAITARSPQLRQQMQLAAREETDHLVWTQARLDELGAHASWLNPLWYAGAFGIGLVAGRLGDRTSLGFVVETERQVEQHLAEHLGRLPAADVKSRAIVSAMQADERRHADEAGAAGAAELPAPVRWLMRASAKLMTTTAHHV
jgi:3-demethoxyubiquinol 3-hydroxylase